MESVIISFSEISLLSSRRLIFLGKVKLELEMILYSLNFLLYITEKESSLLLSKNIFSKQDFSEILFKFLILNKLTSFPF